MNHEELKNRFTYHPPKKTFPVTQEARYAGIRDRALEFALLLEGYCSDSREKSLAITHLEEAVFWANASIARNE